MSKYLLKCGKLYDGVTAVLYKNIGIVVEDGVIKEVKNNLMKEPGAQVIDLTNYTVTPGMIDAHTHLSVFRWEKRAEERWGTSSAWKAMAVLYNASKALSHGFTTLRFVGCDCMDMYGSLDAKKAIIQGFFKGADLVVAPYYIGSPGGMADSSRNISGNYVLSHDLEQQYPGVGSGRDFFMAAVRNQIKMGADYIKVMANGGFSNPKGSPEDDFLFDEEYEAIIGTAQKMHVPVTAHAYSPQTIKKLVMMGINGIEHGSLMDEETAEMMEKKSTWLVPTFCQYDEICNLDTEALLKREPPEFREKLRQYGDNLRESRKIIISSKIKMGYGSDILDIHNSYECGYEYQSWINNGIDPFRALEAATSINAKILGKNDRGRIVVGMRADITGWERDLLQDPQSLLKCNFVMKNGTIYETEGECKF